MIDGFNYSELLGHSTLLPKSLKIDFLSELQSPLRSPESQEFPGDTQGHLLTSRLPVALAAVTGSRTFRRLSKRWWGWGLCLLFLDDLGDVFVTAQGTGEGWAVFMRTSGDLTDDY